jgi:hypothetical protein
MATTHGAGQMLWPALMPLCLPGGEAGAAGTVAATLAGVGIHILAMVATTAVVAAVVFEWLGLALLRRAWVNVDLLWVLALLVTGGLLLSSNLARVRFGSMMRRAVTNPPEELVRDLTSNQPLVVAKRAHSPCLSTKETGHGNRSRARSRQAGTSSAVE